MLWREHFNHINTCHLKSDSCSVQHQSECSGLPSLHVVLNSVSVTHLFLYHFLLLIVSSFVHAQKLSLTMLFACLRHHCVLCSSNVKKPVFSFPLLLFLVSLISTSPYLLWIVNVVSERSLFGLQKKIISIID